ncbi:MAG TPA: alcohol dehydrogenase catalytic domain-containing protein [Luteitalea sp.]|nr:alcohol dehydrogenase catalytic domain-containing protein [Luteitalea sp.]
MEINAYAIHVPGGQAERFVYERRVGRRDVVVRITHRSLARGDVQYIDNAWDDTRYPLVPCHEIVGVVEDAGDEVMHLRAGDRVGVGYQLVRASSATIARRASSNCAPGSRWLRWTITVAWPTTSWSTADSRSSSRRSSIPQRPHP